MKLKTIDARYPRTDSLSRFVNKLVRLVGKREVKRILDVYDAQLEGYPTRKARLRVSRALTVCDEKEIDGG